VSRETPATLRETTVGNLAATTVVVRRLKAARNQLGISQSKLARLSGVSRFRICTHELGDTPLTQDESNRIVLALEVEVEVERLRKLSTEISPLLEVSDD